MTQLLPRTVWHMSEKELLRILGRRSFFSRKHQVRFYAPSFMYYKTNRYCSSPKDFPTISVTGKGCALKCKHCGGIVLDTMYPATAPEELFDLCRGLKEDGASGCLISGGCSPDGSVPLESFVDAIHRIKSQLGLTVFVHSGLIDINTAKMLSKAGVDSVLTDIIGSNETIKEVCGLNLTVKDYANTLRALRETGIAFVPHVIAGLHYGKLKGELQALEMIAKYKPSALVIIAFMPVRGTEMENVEPPSPLDITKVIAVARLMLPKTPLVLGCMRPKGKHRTETDILAIRAGVDAIAFPTEAATRFAENQGCKTSFSSFCCSRIYVDIKA